MRVITVVVLCLMMAGCCPCKQIASTDSKRDSVRIEYRESVVFVRDTVRIEIPAEQMQNTTRDTTSYLRTSLAESRASVTGGILTHSLKQRAQIVEKEAKTKVIYRDSIVYRDRVQTKTERIEVEKRLSWWQRWRFWLLLAFVGVYFGNKAGVFKVIGAMIFRKL